MVEGSNKYFIPKEVIEQIRERADIVQILNPYVELRRAGKNFIGACPFHQETKPSFTVNPITQSYYCFGCGAGGNVFSFFMDYDNLSFPDAVRLVANQVGIAIPKQVYRSQAAVSKDIEENESLFNINRSAGNYFIQLLWQASMGKIAREYLSSREIDRELAKTFQLGLSPQPWTKLYDYLKKKGFSLEQLIKSGLFIQKEDTNRVYDRFRNRLMFPILDSKRRFRGFAGRTLASSDDEAKYINSPETMLYKKRKILFGLAQNRDFIRQARSVIIVEGYFDLIMLYKAGFKNVVATCGTALTESHINVIRRYTRTIYLLFDSDAAGIKAVYRSLDLLIESDFEVSICVMKDAKDPDEFIKERGGEAFNQIIQNAMKPFDFLLTFSKKNKDFSNSDEVISFLDELTPYLIKISDPVKRALLIGKIADLTPIDDHDLISRLRKKLNNRQANRKITLKKSTKYADFELYLITILLHYPKMIETYREQLLELKLTNEKLFEILHTIISLEKKHSIKKPEQWVEKWGVFPYKNVVARLCIIDTVEKRIHSEIQGCIDRVKEKQYKDLLRIARKNLEKAQKNGNSEDLIPLLKKIQDLSSLLQKLRVQKN